MSDTLTPDPEPTPDETAEAVAEEIADDRPAVTDTDSPPAEA